MGNSNSISVSASAPNIEPTDYHIIGKTSVIRWGEVFEMKNSQVNQKVLMHEVFTQDADTYHNHLEQCSDRLSLSHSNLAGLLGFSPSEIPDPVTNRYSICLYFEHVATSLADLIDARAEALNSAQNRTPKKINSKQYYFDESELMRFLNQLVDVFAYLQMSGINLGDITPDVCYVTETGNIKILDKKIIFDDRTTFDLISQGATFAFATPGELKALENGFTRCAENRYKADLFRVGMVIVECATLQNSCDVYDWRAQSINIEALSARLIDIKARYSESFYNIVREMLRFDETKRLDFVELNQRIQDEADTKLGSTMSMSKSGEQSLKNSQVKTGPAVEPPLNSKGNDISPSNRTPQKETNVTKNLRDQYMQSMGRERERERRMDKKSRKDDDTDDTHEFEDNMKVNTIRLTQPRSSIGNVHNPDNSYEMPPSQINLNKSTLANFERVSYQEASRRTTPNSSKKETPMKPSPDSLRKGNSMKTTPSKLRIFDPVKSPQALQNIGFLSPASRIHEQPRQTTPSKPTEEYAEKMYSPFNHRPSRSDITTPTAEQQQKINYDNLRNFPQLGRYTTGYNTPSAEKPTPTPENRLTNKANTSPEQFAPAMYQNSPSHIKGNPIQFGDQSVHGSVPESHRSTASNVFGTNPVYNELHYIEDPSPQWGYSSAVQPSFGNLEGSFKGSFHNTQPAPVANREDNRGPRGFNVQEDESLRMSFQDRSSLPNFGGHTPADEILVSPAFGLSTSEQLKKSAPKKIDVTEKLKEDKALGVDDRFARAMERSKRSEGFVKEMSRSLSKSPLRKE